MAKVTHYDRLSRAVEVSEAAGVGRPLVEMGGDVISYRELLELIKDGSPGRGRRYSRLFKQFLEELALSPEGGRTNTPPCSRKH